MPSGRAAAVALHCSVTTYCSTTVRRGADGGNDADVDGGGGADADGGSGSEESCQSEGLTTAQEKDSGSLVVQAWAVEVCASPRP